MGCGTVGASADFVKIRFSEESTFATPSTGAYEEVPIVSESLTANTETTESNEISGDRRIAEISRTDFSAGGDLDFELSYQSGAVGTSRGYDLAWEAAFQSAAWTSQVQATLAGAAADGFKTIATSTTAYAQINASVSTFGSFVVGQIISIKGAANSANNTFCKIVTVSNTVMDVIVLNSTGDFVDEGSSSAVITQGPYITDGSTCRSFTFEKEFSDLSSTFAQYVGQVFSGFKLAIPTKGNVTAGFSVLGAKETSPSPTATAASSVNKPELNSKLSSVDNVSIFTENNAKFDIVSFDMQGTNNLRLRSQVANLGAVSVGSGKLNLSGKLQAFFADSTFYNKYLAFTETSLKFVFKDTAGNAYVFDIPAVNLTAGARVAGGASTDVINDMTWTAKKHSTEGIMIRMARFDSADVA